MGRKSAKITFMNRFQRALNRVGKLFGRENLKTEAKKRSRTTIRSQLTTYPYRVENSVHEWESAYLNAVNPIMPQRARLCAIYDKCMMDDEVAHQVRLAKNNLEFRPFSTNSAELDKLFEQEWFADFANSVIDAEMCGYSVVEIAIKNDTIVCEPIPHENIAHAYRQILLNSSDTNGQNVDDLTQQGYGLVEIGKPKYLGVMNIIAKCAIRKEFSLSDWSMRNEKFGMPFTSLRTEAEDSDEIAERRKMLQNMGSASWGIFDKDDELSFVETGAGAGAHKTYQDFVDSRDKAIAKLVNGQTATSNENAFVGSSEVHERTQFAYTQSRMNRIEKVVNAQILPILARFGFNVSNAIFEYTKPKAPKESAKKEDPKSPTKQGLGSNLEVLSSKFSIQDLFESAIKRYFDGFDTIADKYLAEYNFSQIWNEVKKPVLRSTDDAKEIQQNIWVFSVFKSHENAMELTDALTDDNGKIRNWRDYREIATQITQKYNVEYLRTERETALGVAKMAQNWKDIENIFGEKAMLRYLTVGDARVRECHKKLDGVTLPADHEFWKEFYPLNGWRCRCSVKVVEDDAIQTPDYYMPTEKEVPISFRFNAGQSNRLFNDNHPYFAVDTKTAAKIKGWIRENPKPES
jgi:Protein of unknown function (DUF935)/Phage Mu protein F like protein